MFIKIRTDVYQGNNRCQQVTQKPITDLRTVLYFINLSLTVRGKAARLGPQPVFGSERKAEAESNRGPSASHPYPDSGTVIVSK